MVGDGLMVMHFVIQLHMLPVRMPSWIIRKKTQHLGSARKAQSFRETAWEARLLNNAFLRHLPNHTSRIRSRYHRLRCAAALARSPVGRKYLSGRRGDILAYIGADNLPLRQGAAGDGSCGA